MSDQDQNVRPNSVDSQICRTFVGHFGRNMSDLRSMIVDTLGVYCMCNDLKLNIKMTSPQNILDKIRTASKSTFTKRLRKNKDILLKHIRKTF